MRAALVTCAVAVGLAAGCRLHAPAPQPRQATPSVAPVSAELPPVTPTRTEPDLRTLPKSPVLPASASSEITYRRLTEPLCQRLAAQNSATANALDAEGRVPAECEPSADRLKQTIRFHAALELRNRAAADGLDRFFQLADAEARTDLLRQAFPILDDVLAKARAARAADVRFPLEPADLQRQRSQLASQLDQAEAGIELLNVDLKRRLGLPALPASERLWPGGEFGIDASPVDPEQAVTAALADRPELRGLRALYHGLSPESLPLAREQLRAGNPLLGGSPSPTRGLARFLAHKADPAALAELEVRRKQLADLIAARERDVADEARAAAIALNARTRRVQLARDRLDAWAARRADAIRKREAKQPGAELLEAQVTMEWLKARAEVVSEVTAWHQARVRLKAAQGWLAWEALGDGR